MEVREFLVDMSNLKESYLMNLVFNKIKSSVVLKNFTFVTIGSISAQLLNLLALIKIARIFSPEAYGLYTFLTIQGLLIFTIADIGIKNIIIRTIARDKETTKDVVYNGILIRLISVIIFSLIYFLYNIVAGSLSTVNVILVCIFSFSNCITNLFESAFWGHQKMLTPAIANVATSLLWYIIVLFLPAQSVQVSTLFLIFLSINALTALTYFITLKAKKLLIGVRQSFKTSASMLLKQSWPYFVLVLLGLPYNYLTNNFLDINSTKTEIGYFNLTQKLMSPISLVITFSLSSLFPNLSNLWTNDEKRFKAMLNKGILYFLLSALMLCFVYTVFAPYIIKFLFSEKYYPAIRISQIQVWYVFLMGVNSLIGTIWGATNNEKLLVKSSLINILIAGPLLYWGSKHGALGLSYTYVISFAIFEVYLWLSFKKTLNLTIKNDFLLWLYALTLFLISYFSFDVLSIFSLTMVTLCVVIFTLYIFFIKVYNPIKSK